MVILVAAQAQNRVIGRDNMVPWRMRSDLVRLVRLTKGQVVVLGRKTYDSMDEYYRGTGREMPGGHYLVVTRDSTFKPARSNASAVHSVPDALEKAREFGDGDVFVIGGGQVFAAALELVDRIYLTEVKADIEGDAYFPVLDPAVWRVAERETHEADERNEYPFEFVTYERAAPLQT
jgi:dihydrofolate reductase